MPSKRINQLQEVYRAADGDLLAIDIAGGAETRKIQKANLLQEYVVDAPREVATQDWYWARRNGAWYRIYPDDYVMEAPVDGGIYVRVNARWVKVTGVTGDMLQSIYDTRVRSEDIFNFVIDSLGIQDSATEGLLGHDIVLTGEKIIKDFGIISPIKNLLIKGTAVAADTSGIGEKSFEHPALITGINSLTLYKSGKDLYRDQKVVSGSYTDSKNISTIHTFDPTRVNSGEVYTLFKARNREVKLISTDKYNQPIGWTSPVLHEGDNITIPDGVEYIGLEIRDYKIVDNKYVYSTMTIPYSQYMDFLFSIDNQFESYNITLDSPMMGLPNGVSDYIDVTAKEVVHNIEQLTLTNLDDWFVTPADTLTRGATIAFGITKGTAIDWDDMNVNYGEADVLYGRKYNDFVTNDVENISFYGGTIYVRVRWDRFTGSPSETDTELLIDFKQFISTNPINTYFEAISSLPNTPVSTPDLMLYDSFTTLYNESTVSLDGESYILHLDMTATFDAVINHLIRTSGGWIDGQLGVRGGILTPFVTGIDTNDAESVLRLNPNSQERVLVNNDNEMLDRRDFSTEEDVGRADQWAPEVITVADIEADDNRIANTAYIKRDYAPLNSPNLVGTPTAPTADAINTSQIATGEFVENFYYNKTAANETFITTVDGIAKTPIVLDAVIEGDETNGKIIPNIDYINLKYPTREEISDVYAPIDSPNFTGTPNTPWPAGIDQTEIANTGWVTNNYVSKTGDGMAGTYTLSDRIDAEGNIEFPAKMTATENVFGIPIDQTKTIPYNIFDNNVTYSGPNPQEYGGAEVQWDGTVSVYSGYYNGNFINSDTMLSTTALLGNYDSFLVQIFDSSPSGAIAFSSIDGGTLSHVEIGNFSKTLPRYPSDTEFFYFIVTKEELINAGVDLLIPQDILFNFFCRSDLNESYTFTLAPMIVPIQEGIDYNRSGLGYKRPGSSITVGGIINKNKVVVTSDVAELITSPITTTELGMLHGIRANVQEQIDAGGGGSGDMKASIYDPDMEVATEGGIAAYVANHGGQGSMDVNVYDPTKAVANAGGIPAYIGTATAASARTLATARTIALAGKITGSVVFNGSSNVSMTTEVGTLTKSDLGLGSVDNIKQMPIAGGTFTGNAIGNNGTDYGTLKLRNIKIVSTDPGTGTTSSDPNGTITLVYV